MKPSLRFIFAAMLLVLAACSQEDDLVKPADVRAPTSTATAETSIQNGAPVTNLSGARLSQRYDSITVPSGATNLRISISGGTGDADLYVRFGSRPTTSSYDCRPFRAGNSETCTVSAPRVGTYEIMIRGYSAYSGVTLSASYTGGSTTPTTPTGAFDVTFVFGPNVTSTQRTLFEQAATRWEQVITGDIVNATVNKATNACGSNEPAYNGTVDDVVIYAEIGPRDGAGGVLASAGPCLIRSGSRGLTTYGIMNFDSADSTGGDLYETILHEMGHVLGIGTLWERFGLVNYSNTCPSTPRYFGSSARAEWNALGGSGDVPVEQGGGSGTRCGHWDEETFSTELMTGYSEGAAAEPLSRMTAGTLQDMSYTVNKAAANPYSLPTCSPNCRQLAPQMQELEGREILLEPIGFTTPDGTIRRFNPTR